jgi:glutathione S-transferase
VLGESAAIVEYLCATHGGGRLTIAPGRPGYADYLFWFHFANGSLMPAAMVGLVAGMLGGGNAVVASLSARLDTAYAMIERRLGETPYLAGAAFTAADLLIVFPLTTMRAFAPRDLSPYPAIRDYLQRIAARPAFARAMAKADPGFAVPLD